MNEIYHRRAIRKFTGEKIPREDLLAVLKAGMNAPSGKNRMPWQFVVIDEGDLLRELMEVSPYWGMLENAGQAILVCGDLNINDDEYYHYVDGAIAGENMLLEIDSLGYGGVWLCAAPRKENMEGLARVLNLPESFVPVVLIALGYPAEEKAVNNKFMEEKIFYNRF